MEVDYKQPRRNRSALRQCENDVIPSALFHPSAFGVIMQSTDKVRPKILLGLTGSVATIRASMLVRQLSDFADVQVKRVGVQRAVEMAFYF